MRMAPKYSILIQQLVTNYDDNDNEMSINIMHVLSNGKNSVLLINMIIAAH